MPFGGTAADDRRRSSRAAWPRFFAFAFILPLLLSACGSLRDALPAGVGTGRDELKRSPCACLELLPKEAPGAWRDDVERQLRRSLGRWPASLPFRA